MLTDGIGTVMTPDGIAFDVQLRAQWEFVEAMPQGAFSPPL